MDQAAEALIAHWDDLRLVITMSADGWLVHAFEADQSPGDGMKRGPYANLESAKKGAFETATELFGYSLQAQDLKWTVTVGDLP